MRVKDVTVNDKQLNEAAPYGLASRALAATGRAFNPFKQGAVYTGQQAVHNRKLLSNELYKALYSHMKVAGYGESIPASLFVDGSIKGASAQKFIQLLGVNPFDPREQQKDPRFKSIIFKTLKDIGVQIPQQPGGLNTVQLTPKQLVTFASQFPVNMQRHQQQAPRNKASSSPPSPAPAPSIKSVLQSINALSATDRATLINQLSGNLSVVNP